jgi:phage repressor protein C with HTH and peptisase S24 domain
MHDDNLGQRLEALAAAAQTTKKGKRWRAGRDASYSDMHELCSAFMAAAAL